MRPGQLTPENRTDRVQDQRVHGSFNEAGAINPGKQSGEKMSIQSHDGFNEAGAINPGKLCRVSCGLYPARTLQ